MFRSVLVANRGEIACRIMRTARALGVRTIAVYSDADAGAAHVAAADAAVHIGPAAPRESYLAIDRLIAAARRAGAEAVHPGYGFLSENAAFAEACAAAGLVFIGPPPSAIRAMGLKDAAKALMARAGVPVVPGYHGEAQEPALLAAEADRIGYPVLIKAVAGGGGKGMRRVDDPAQFSRALAGAQREAQAAFGDARVLIERYVTRPRHIEIQVFADAHGQAVSLFERDCSLQRRHQKVIEEAPAPLMPPEMRRAMGQAAVTAAQAIGYRGAGTVEFIADASEGLKADRFFFMEMNTRLQVEHPVTEMVTGLDLVHWQFLVAAGERLPLGQDGLALDGHAIEARLYAEDPSRGFLPSTGRLHRLRLPAEGPHLRVDAGVREGDEVSVHYDPMIAKIIAWDRDRPAAIRRLVQALAATEVAGVRTNAAFLIACLQHPEFAGGEVDTGLIDRHLAALAPKAGLPDDRTLALATLGELLSLQAAALAEGDPRDPWSVLDGYRVGRSGHGRVSFVHEETRIDVDVTYEADGYTLALPGGALRVRGVRDADGTLAADLGGLRVRAGVTAIGARRVVTEGGHAHVVTLFDPLAMADAAAGPARDIAAPMPGRLIQVLVKPGEEVQRGQALAVLEAMKMEHTLVAPAAVRVGEVRVAAGDQVGEGAVLITFAAPDGAAA